MLLLSALGAGLADTALVVTLGPVSLLLLLRLSVAVGSVVTHGLSISIRGLRALLAAAAKIDEETVVVIAAGENAEHSVRLSRDALGIC